MSLAPFPALDPYRTDELDVGDGHVLYIEQSGNPHGTPVLAVHGGPASASSPRQRRFFDPKLYRIVLFDQRGSGRSRPAGEQARNSTDDLLADMERIRKALGIARWLVFGGSWGATLTMLYAGKHPQHCLGVVLRGSFLAEQADLDWFFHGAASVLPDGWHAFDQRVPRHGEQSLMQACLTTLAGHDDPLAAEVTAAWLDWEASLSQPGRAPAKGSPAVAAPTLAKYRLQAAYLARQCDLKDGQVLACAEAAKAVPMAIVHGRLDLVCRPINAWRIALCHGSAPIAFVDGAGHDPYHSGMASKLIEATNVFARHGHFEQLRTDWIRP